VLVNDARMVDTMKISIASGKGGTGKTLVATNLALAIDSPVQLLDCDVEEPNAHIFFKGPVQNEQVVYTLVPQIDEKLCQYCGLCTEVCAFNAIALFEQNFLIFADLCHNCSACWRLCPHGAIVPKEREVGTVTTTETDGVRLVTGRVKVGVHASPPVIKAVKEKCSQGINILDGPPGSSCPVLETVSDTDYCVLVTEPTPFGLNDLKLAVEMITTLGLKCGVVINRDGPDSTIIEEFCHSRQLPILMRIPFERDIASSYARGTLLVHQDLKWREQFAALYHRIVREVQRA